MFKQFLKHTPFGISLIVLFTAVLFLVAILPVFGNKTLIVRTGSMSPEIGVGDLIFVFPKQNYEVGDVIAFKEGGKGQTTITHRIASVKSENGQTLYQTKGDANKLPDDTLVPKGNILGSADYSIKSIGKIFAMVKTKNGFLLTAIIPAALVIILEFINIINALRKPKVRFAPSVISETSIMPTTNPVIPRSDITSDRGTLFKRLLRFSRNDKVENLLSSQPVAVAAEVVPTQKVIVLKKSKFHYRFYGKPMGLFAQSASLRSLIGSFLEKINFRSLKPNVGMPYYATSFKAILPYAIVVILFTGTTFATTYSDSEESKGNSFKAASAYPSQAPTASPNNLITSTDNPIPSPSPTPQASPESTPSASPET